VFPEFVPAGPVLEAHAVGHPLLSEDVCVRSDFELGGAVRLAIISGSNMSGKSTFLRAVALNVALARMGAPVRCAWLRMSDLRVGASILVHDSLAEGRSHYLAELERLRQIIEAAGRGPLLFAIDEILIGTNSRDRAVAAEWVARALMDRSAVGLISTHDLALTAMGESPRLRGANYHFADTGHPSGLEFDYKLKPGVVERSNALSIARSLGINAGEPSA
jgi:DNA mismatch repair ATPase MutS